MLCSSADERFYRFMLHLACLAIYIHQMRDFPYSAIVCMNSRWRQVNTHRESCYKTNVRGLSSLIIHLKNLVIWYDFK